MTTEAMFKILHMVDPGGNPLQPGRDRLPFPHYTDSRRDEL